jgi:hypothetical protein
MEFFYKDSDEQPIHFALGQTCSKWFEWIKNQQEYWNNVKNKHKQCRKYHYWIRAMAAINKWQKHLNIFIRNHATVII